MRDGNEGLPLVARVAPGQGKGQFVVEFVAPPAVSQHTPAVLAAVREELDFFLVEKDEPNPWAYAKYHCGTVSNMYGEVHWALRRGAM